MVSGIDDIWGASFEVRFPDGIAQFASLDLNDSFLAEGASNLIISSGEIEPGLWEIGFSRDASDTPVGVTPGANTQLARLIFFRIATAGDGPVTIEDASLFILANPGDPPTELVVPFSGGEFDIRD